MITVRMTESEFRFLKENLENTMGANKIDGKIQWNLQTSLTADCLKAFKGALRSKYQPYEHVEVNHG